MNREYKFRAWDEKHGLMYSIISINFSDNVATGVTNGEWYEFDIENIMQFTGSKDINNIEIYEGDYMLDSHSGCWGEVKFYKGAFIVEFDNEIQDLYDWTCECVIGNIYENPELLEYR